MVQCGTTWKYEKRVGEMLKANAKNDVVFFALRSSLNDTPESIRKYAESKHFDMPVLDGLCAVLLNKGDAKAAEEAIDKLAKIDPTNQDLPQFREKLAALKKPK